jgi:hypothetical protein
MGSHSDEEFVERLRELLVTNDRSAVIYQVGQVRACSPASSKICPRSQEVPKLPRRGLPPKEKHAARGKPRNMFRKQAKESRGNASLLGSAGTTARNERGYDCMRNPGLACGLEWGKTDLPLVACEGDAGTCVADK